MYQEVTEQDGGFISSAARRAARELEQKAHGLHGILEQKEKGAFAELTRVHQMQMKEQAEKHKAELKAMEEERMKTHAEDICRLQSVHRRELARQWDQAYNEGRESRERDLESLGHEMRNLEQAYAKLRRERENSETMMEDLLSASDEGLKTKEAELKRVHAQRTKEELKAQEEKLEAKFKRTLDHDLQLLIQRFWQKLDELGMTHNQELEQVIGDLTATIGSMRRAPRMTREQPRPHQSHRQKGHGAGPLPHEYTFGAATWA